MNTENEEKVDNSAEAAVEETQGTGPGIETDAAPEMAAAVNVSADAGTESQTESPHEAPEKVELTEEEQAQHMRMVIAQQTLNTEKDLEQLLNEVHEKGFHQYMYGKDSTVELPGNLFAHMINFVVAVKAHNDNMKSIFQGVIEAQDSISLDALCFQLDFTKRHSELCAEGKLLSPEQVEELEAEKKIQEVTPAEQPKREKARGTEDEVERPSAKVDSEEE